MSGRAWMLDAEGWLEEDGKLRRADNVRVSLHIDLSGDGMPVDEDGDPSHYKLVWLVQLPGPYGNYECHHLEAGLSPIAAMAEVDKRWPRAPWTHT